MCRFTLKNTAYKLHATVQLLSWILCTTNSPPISVPRKLRFHYQHQLESICAEQKVRFIIRNKEIIQ